MMGDNEESWCTHSPNLASVLRCRAFEHSEHVRNRVLIHLENGANEVRRNQQNTSSTKTKIPMNAILRTRIYECALLSFKDKVTPRRIGEKEISALISKIKTELREEKETEDKTQKSDVYELESCVNSIFADDMNSITLNHNDTTMNSSQSTVDIAAADNEGQTAMGKNNQYVSVPSIHMH